MIELPKKFKKQIIDFTQQYEQLCNPHKIRITIPEIKITATVLWSEDNKCYINEEDIDRASNIYDKLYESKEIENYNNRIKKFIKETDLFGQNNFSDENWLWDNVLWNFNPDEGKKFDFKKVKWI